MSSSPNTLVFIDIILDRHHRSRDSHTLFLNALFSDWGKVHSWNRVDEKREDGVYEIHNEFKVIPLPYYSSLGKDFLKVLRSMRSIRKRNSYEILYLCWPHPISLWLVLTRKKESRVFLVARSNDGEVIRSKYSGIKKILGLLYLKLSDRLIPKDATIMAIGSELHSLYLRKRRSVYDLQDPLPAETKEDLPSSAQEMKTILFVGRLEPQKGLPTLIRAFSKLPKDLQARLILVGEGSMQKELQEMVIQENLQEKIHFTGYIPFGNELFDLYKKADALIIPSPTEGVPKVIQEAQLFDLPIIATKVGGIPNVIEHGSNGWLIPSGSETSLHQAMLEFLDGRISFSAPTRKKGKMSDHSFWIQKHRSILMAH